MDKNLVKLGQAAVLVIIGFIAAITNIELWYMAAEGYTDAAHVIYSIINLVAEGVGITYFMRKLFFNKK